MKQFHFTTTWLLLVMMACSADEDVISCDNTWKVESTSKSSARIENGSLLLSVTDPSVANELKLTYPLEPASSKPNRFIVKINYESFNAGANLSYDGYFAASVAYENDLSKPLFKFKMWEKYVEMVVGENYHTREITIRQARGSVEFTYGTFPSSPNVGAIQYSPANSTQELRGSGTFTFTDDPLVLILEAGGSNFTPSSPSISIQLSEVAYSINRGIGDFITESFNCNSLDQ